MKTKKFCLTEKSDAHAMVQHRGRHAQQTAARRCTPRPKQPVTKEQMSRDLRRGADRPGDVRRSGYIDIPEEVQEIYRIWRPDAARAGDGAGKGARHAREDLFQERERVARRVRTSPTPPCRRPTTTTNRASSSLTTETGAGQWGAVDRLRGQALRHRPAGITWSRSATSRSPTAG